LQEFLVGADERTSDFATGDDIFNSLFPPTIVDMEKLQYLEKKQKHLKRDLTVSILNRFNYYIQNSVFEI
jgi:hypothetical protein